MLRQVYLYIKGDVIGVGFRAWTKIQAKIIGINGWIRNVYNKPENFGVNGGVEVLIQAEESKIKKMIEVLKKGPPISRIDNIEIYWQDPKEIFEDFVIKI